MTNPTGDALKRAYQLDEDLFKMSEFELACEVRKLRRAVRKHMNEKGHDRCWLSDLELYQALPEGNQADLRLPPKEEFLKECELYYKNRTIHER